MKLNQTPNFRPASPVINNWQFRSSANLTDSPYVRPAAVQDGKPGMGNKIMLGTAAFVTATAPVLAQTGSTPAAADLLDKVLNYLTTPINVLTMPLSIVYSYVTFGNAHQRGFILAAVCVGAYAAGRRIFKKQIDRTKDKWGHGVLAKLGRETIRHVSGAAAAAVTYYALAPAVSWIGKIVVDAWSKL